MPRRSGWVMFNNENDFQLIHNAEKLAQSYPLYSRRRGRIRTRDALSRNITIPRPKIQGILDRTVIAYFKDEYWPNTDFSGFTFLTFEQTVDYFGPFDDMA